LEKGTPAIIIAGKYRLLKQLGRGSMGTVWQAEHLTLRSLVAVKMMDPAIGFSKTALQRFMTEARAAAGMRSPHVVQVLDHGVDGNTPYIVMELLEGETLAARLKRVRTLSPRQTSRFVTHVARALSRAERAGITHRDLKPDNVFLLLNEDEEIAKVLDFGVAKIDPSGYGAFGEGEPTAAGALLGTPYYASPEQAEGLKTIDHRTDIWSLGVMTYECLVGRRPFDGTSLPDLLLSIVKKPLPVPSQHGDVPAGFDAWFAKACARDVQARFESARAAATELSRLCDAGELSSADWTVRRAPEARPFDLPRLKLGDTQVDAADDEDDDEDEAPTEIWRGEHDDSLDGEPSDSFSHNVLPPPRAPRPSLPAPPLAALPAPLPLRAAARSADGRGASANAFSATSLPRRSASRRSQIIALAGLALLSASGGFWLASRQPQLSAAAVSAAAAGNKPPSAAPSAPPSAAAVVPPPPVASDELRTVDLDQLPTAARPRGGAPRFKPPGASTAAKAPKAEEDDVPNPYR
jgi:serine/threonine-protein kinase